MKYTFGTKINGTEESGIIDIDTMKLICLCPKSNSELILQALNKDHDTQRNELLIDFAMYLKEKRGFIKRAIPQIVDRYLKSIDC